MSGIIHNLDYFRTYKREVANRSNELAKMSAMRELVAVAKALVSDPEFPLLAAEHRTDIADAILTCTAELMLLDEARKAERHHTSTGMAEELEIVHGQMLIRDEAFKARQQKKFNTEWSVKI